MTLRVDGVLFDKDGTLFDFEATWGSWARDMLGRLSGDDPLLRDRIASALGYDPRADRFDRSSPAIAGTPDDVAAIVGPILGRGTADLVAEFNASAAVAPMVESVPLTPLLGGLKTAGLALGVATNDAEAPMKAHLEGVGITGFFAYAVGYDSGFGAKPAPGMCLGFSTTLGLDPSRCVMVGDSLHDLHAGRAAGMQTIAVLTGLATEDELAPHADAVLPDIGRLPGWLGLDAA